ncbi:MAG: hypothetical protein ACRDL2_00645 [Gaiellaceae bacterium]
MRRPLILVSIVVVAVVSLLAAGCGGGGGSTGVAAVTTSTTATTTTTQDPRVAFARCMRSHGVPKWPDVGKPTPQQAGVSNSQFQAGVAACRQLLPNGGSTSQETAQQKRTRIADELSFAKCMRSHGVARFPDPTAQGDLSVEIVQAQGIDVHSTAVLHVVQACLPASHGALTAAKVGEALKNAGG